MLLSATSNDVGVNSRLVGYGLSISGYQVIYTGFPHLGVEAMLKQVNKLLLHYGCQTALGMELQTSMELLVVDLGLSFQPFCISYDQYGDWVTTSWLKRVWEKVSFFDFELPISNLSMSYPGEGDNWLIVGGYIIA